MANAPANVRSLGLVDEQEKLAWLALADIGLNPVLSGSGTNLKLLDYAAAGLPIVSTPFGARGAGLETGKHLWQAEPEHLAARLKEVLALPIEEKVRITLAARKQVEATLDWQAIATAFAEKLGLADEPRRPKGAWVRVAESSPAEQSGMRARLKSSRALRALARRYPRAATLVWRLLKRGGLRDQATIALVDQNELAARNRQAALNNRG